MCEKAKKLVFGNWRDNEADAEKVPSLKYASWSSSDSDTSGQSRSLQASSSVSASHFVAERRFEIRHGIRGQKPKLKVRSQSSSGPRSARGSFKATSKNRSMSEGRGKFNLQSSSESSDSGPDSSSGSELDSKSGSSSDSESTTGSSSHGTDMEGRPRMKSAVLRIHETWQSANSSKSVKTYREHFQSRSRSSSLPRVKRVCLSTPQRDLTYGSPEAKSPANRGRNSWKKSQSRSMSCSPIPKVSVNRSLTRSRSPHRNTWSQSKSLSPPTWKLPMDEGYNNDVHYRERHNITLTSWDGRAHPEPVLSFERSGFNATILQQLEDQGFDAPTPIQAQTWSIAEEGRNIVMISGKGTGKTLGYLLPGIMNIDNQRGLMQRKKGPIVLILVDGRDAAMTVQREVLYYSNPLELRTYCLLGGSQWQCHAECDLLVASAGRLLQMLDNKKHVVELERCTYLVVDDIDRMIDVGLEGSICRLLCRLRKRAQLVVTSTSWSSNLKRLAKKFMGQYTAILVGQVNDLGMQLQNIRQRVEVVNGLLKIDRLMEELAAIYDTSDIPGKVVIYVKRQKVVEELVDLIRKFVPCEGIHSGCTAQEREEIIRNFGSGAYNIIVATQMSSTYLDVPGIRYVINYDFPDTIEKYAQRLSRSGWLTSNSNCEVISFFTRANYRLVMGVVAFLKDCKQEIGPHLLQIAEEKEFGPRQRKRHRPPRYNRKQ